MIVINYNQPSITAATSPDIYHTCCQTEMCRKVLLNLAICEYSCIVAIKRSAHKHRTNSGMKRFSSDILSKSVAAVHATLLMCYAALVKTTSDDYVIFHRIGFVFHSASSSSKLHVLTFQAMNGSAPVYLSSYFTRVTDMPSRLRLRSSIYDQL